MSSAIVQSIMASSKDIVIFYSWQTDSPDATNRRAIRNALRNASSELEAVFSKEKLRLILEEATRDEPGSPNIPQRIIEKIDRCHIFVCDVTTINFGATNVKRKTPNPNVTYELGYAVARLGWSRIVMLLNKRFGSLTDLPFDIDRQRASPYHLDESAARSTKPNADVQRLVLDALKLILEKNPPFSAKTLNPEMERRRRDVINLRWLMVNVHWPTVEEHLKDAPRFVSDDLLHFFEGFQGVLQSKSFYLYDRKLARKLEEVHQHWARSIFYYAHYVPLRKKGLVFSGRLPIWTPEQKKDWDKMVAALKKLEPALDDLLKDVREEYLEINLNETNQAAWNAYVALQNRFSEMMSQPPKRQSKKRSLEHKSK
jgi:hypothetical protein